MYPYHPDLTSVQDSKRGGYIHNLTAPQQQILSQLQEWVRNERIDVSNLNKFALDPTLTLLRYLRATQFDLTKTTTRINANLAWRRINNVNEISSENPDAILGCPMARVTQIFPHWHCGYDRFGRPVLYKQYSLFDIAKLKAVVGMQRLERYHIWEQEQCMILCEMQSHKRKQIIETCVAIIDIEHMRLSQVTSEFVAMVKAMAELDSDQYPETLGAIYIINAPSAFPFAWRMVKNFLDPAVAAKISIYSSNKKDWQGVLHELIGSENIPANYGGQLDPLTLDRHPYEESMLTLGLDNTRNVVPRVGGGGGRGAIQEDESDDDEYKVGDAPNGHAAAGAPGGGGLRRYRNLEGRIMIDISAHPSTIANTQGGRLFSHDSNLGLQDELESSDGNIYVDALDSESKIRALNLDFAEDISDGENNTNNNNNDDMDSSYCWCSRLWNINIQRLLANASTAQLNRILIVFITVYSIIALLAMGFSAYQVSSRNWIYENAKEQLWTGVVVLLFSIVIIFSNCIGIMGIYYKNRILIKFFGFCSLVGMVVFLIVAIACFLYAGNTRFKGWGNSLIHKTFHTTAAENIKQYQFIVGSCSIVAAIISLGPISISYVLNTRMRRFLGSKLSVGHVRLALRVSLYVEIVTAGIMLVYGGSSLEYLMFIDFSMAMFPVYGLIYGGITMLLISIFGLWTSYIKDTFVLKVYYRIMLPFLTVLLFVAAAVSIGFLNRSAHQLEKKYSNHSVEVLRVQTQLMVAALLCLFSSVFQFVSLFSTRALVMALEQERAEEAAGIHSGNNANNNENQAGVPRTPSIDAFLMPSSIKRGWLEKCMMSWAIVYGLYVIYFDGTFVIFASFAHRAANSQNSGSWVNFAWHILGKLDKRFLSNDGYVVSSSAILSLIVGPLLLLYAWSLYVRASFRGAVGIIASIFLLYSSILYYAIEIHNNFADFSARYSGALIVLFLFTWVSSIALPLYVLYREIRLANVVNRYFDPYSSNPEETERLLQNDAIAAVLANVNSRDEEDDIEMNNHSAADRNGSTANNNNRNSGNRRYVSQLEMKTLHLSSSGLGGTLVRDRPVPRSTTPPKGEETPMMKWINDPNSPNRRGSRSGVGVGGGVSGAGTGAKRIRIDSNGSSNSSGANSPVTGPSGGSGLRNSLSRLMGSSSSLLGNHTHTSVEEDISRAVMATKAKGSTAGRGTTSRVLVSSGLDGSSGNSDNVGLDSLVGRLQRQKSGGGGGASSPRSVESTRADFHGDMGLSRHHNSNTTNTNKQSGNSHHRNKRVGAHFYSDEENDEDEEEEVEDNHTREDDEIIIRLPKIKMTSPFMNPRTTTIHNNNNTSSTAHTNSAST